MNNFKTQSEILSECKTRWGEYIDENPDYLISALLQMIQMERARTEFYANTLAYQNEREHERETCHR